MRLLPVSHDVPSTSKADIRFQIAQEDPSGAVCSIKAIARRRVKRGHGGFRQAGTAEQRVR